MTDQDIELWHKAAKAAGEWDEVHGCVKHPWSPLTNDGDAFRLAVKLGIDVQNMVLPTSNSRPANSDGQGVAYPVNGSYERIVEWYTDGDAVAATRRAITRAAAAIQEAKEGV